MNFRTYLYLVWVWGPGLKINSFLEIDPEAGGSDLTSDCVHRDHHRDVSQHPPGAHPLGDPGDIQAIGPNIRGVLLAPLGGHGHRGLSPHPHHLLLTLVLHLLHSLRSQTQG